MTYATTRARTGDSQTSKDAAHHSLTNIACLNRAQIFVTISTNGPMTAREIAASTGIDYIEVQRRISEVGGIMKTTERRGGCMVWAAA